MEISQVPDKIHEWANNEQWPYEDMQDPGAHFNIVIHPTKIHFMHVAMSNNQRERLTVGVNATFDDPDKVFSTLETNKKIKFVTDVQFFLLQIGVMYRIFPKPPDNVEGVKLMKDIYLESITRERFIDSVQAILRGMIAFKLYVEDLMPSPDRTRTPSLTTEQDRDDRVPFISIGSIHAQNSPFQIGSTGSTQIVQFSEGQN
jgi:hypothetical protein